MEHTLMTTTSNHQFADSHCIDCGSKTYSNSEPCPARVTELEDQLRHAIDENYKLRHAVKYAYLAITDPDLGWIEGTRAAKRFLEGWVK